MKGARLALAFGLAALTGWLHSTCRAVAQETPPAPRPNIVYIMADDLGWKDVGFHGSDIKTPNIDQLAQTGARLDQFYVQPMCTPTRAALLTGRYPFRYGLQTLVIPASMTYGLPTNEWLLPQALKEAGYTTALIGKWHLGHSDRKFWPRQRGFDYFYGSLVGEIDYFTHEVGGKTDWYRNNEVVHEKGYVTTLLGEDAVRFINRQDSKKPFLLYLAFTAPHAPYEAPKEYLDRYSEINDANRRAYAAQITAMDDQIGKVVQALEERGMRRNTVITFLSDNGGNESPLLGEGEVKGPLPADNGPYRGGKGDLYEGGTLVPSLINWPGKIKPGTVVNQMMHVVDYYPTLAGLAGASTSKSIKPLDGFDMWPTISEGKPSPRKEIVYNVEMYRGAVRQEDWKLVWRAVLPPKLELFNLAQDPYEKTNVAEQHPDEVVKVQSRIDGLAREMSKSLLLEQLWQGIVRHVKGTPPALPNEDRFYENAVEP